MGNAFNQHREARIIRTWVATASAAASDSTVTVTKAAAEGQRHILTKVIAGYISPTSDHKLLTVLEGTTDKAYHAIPSPGTPITIQRKDTGPLLFGADNTLVEATVAAGSATGALAVVTIYGYTIGKN